MILSSIFYSIVPRTVKAYSSDSDLQPVHGDVLPKHPIIFYTRINYTLLGVLVGQLGISGTTVFPGELE